MNSQTQQKEQIEVFPYAEEIKRMISKFPTITSTNDNEIKKAYSSLTTYITNKVEIKEKNSKVYACQYFLVPLQKQIKKYYLINNNIFRYYFELYAAISPIIGDYEKDFPFFDWIIQKFIIEQNQFNSQSLPYFLAKCLSFIKKHERGIKIYDKIKNFDMLIKYVIFDLIDSKEILDAIWIKYIRIIVNFQLKCNLYNITTYHFLFNLICIVAIYVFKTNLDDKKNETTTTITTTTPESNKFDLKKYTSEVIDLLGLIINNIHIQSNYMLHKYLLVIVVASKCLNDPDLLDNILQKNTKYQFELKLKLFDLIGISKELENPIKSLKESLWNEDNMSNNINIMTLACKEDYISYQKRINKFLKDKMVLSREFLIDINFQQMITGAVMNIFIRDKSIYDMNKKVLLNSLFKSLLKIKIASLENLINVIMQTFFCLEEYFIFEWEFIFEFFESRRDMFKKHRFFYTYIYKLAEIFNNGNYHGDVKLFEYHFMQWEDLPNDETIQKLRIDFAFKTPYMMITELPKQLEKNKTTTYDQKITTYFFNKIASVYDNDKNNDKVNEAIVKYFLPFFDIVYRKTDLFTEWEKSVITIITKIDDDNVELLKKIFEYLKSKIKQTQLVSIKFIKELIHHSWFNNYFNLLNQVNSMIECFIETIHLKIEEFDVENMSQHINNILKMVKNFSYTCNNEIICGPIQQRNNLSLWKINYKLTYDQNETNQFIIFTHQKLFNLFTAVLSQNKLNDKIKTKLLLYIHELFYKNPFFLTNINLHEFYKYALSKITSKDVIKKEKDLELILSIINDLAYIIPTPYCHPNYKIPPYYFPTKEFPGKKDIKRKCIENLITFNNSLLEQIKKTSPQVTQLPPSECATIEFNGGVVDCGDSEELTSFYSAVLTEEHTHENVNIYWKYIAKTLDCISFQLHSLFNYGAYNVNSKYKNTSNPYTLFKYLQTKQAIKSSSIREQEIRVILDNLIQKLFYPIRVSLTNEETVHVDVITFSFYKLFCHNLELFSVFNDVSLQIIHFLISLSWSRHINEITFKYGNTFPDMRKRLTPVDKNFIAEPNLYLRIQINSLICLFAELSSGGEKLCDILTGILNKNSNDADKIPKEVIQMFLNTLEWHVAIKRKRDAYYNLSKAETENGDSSSSYEKKAETAFVSDKHRVVFTKLNRKIKSKFDVLIYSPFSNSQMHLNLLKKERTNENNYRTFNKLDKVINKFVHEQEDEENANEIEYEDDTISGHDTHNKEFGCFIENNGHILNKGYQFQYLYTNDINEFLPLHDINWMLSISSLSNTLNEAPVNFFCYVNIFYYCPSSSKNSYTNLFNSFLSSLTGVKVSDLQTKLSNDSFLILPTENNQMMISVYNNQESLEKIQKNKPQITSTHSKLDKSISIIWVDHSNCIDKPSYVVSNEKLFVITIYAFSSQYFTIETKVNQNHGYAPFILEKFQMLFQEINVINSNESLRTISNFLIKHIQLLCTITIDKKLTSFLTQRDEYANKKYVTSMYLPKEDNNYFRYARIKLIKP